MSYLQKTAIVLSLLACSCLAIANDDCERVFEENDNPITRYFLDEFSSKETAESFGLGEGAFSQIIKDSKNWKRRDLEPIIDGLRNYLSADSMIQLFKDSYWLKVRTKKYVLHSFVFIDLILDLRYKKRPEVADFLRPDLLPSEETIISLLLLPEKTNAENSSSAAPLLLPAPKTINPKGANSNMQHHSNSHHEVNIEGKINLTDYLSITSEEQGTTHGFLKNYQNNNKKNGKKKKTTYIPANQNKPTPSSYPRSLHPELAKKFFDLINYDSLFMWSYYAKIKKESVITASVYKGILLKVFNQYPEAQKKLMTDHLIDKKIEAKILFEDLSKKYSFFWEARQIEIELGIVKEDLESVVKKSKAIIKAEEKAKTEEKANIKKPKTRPKLKLNRKPPPPKKSNTKKD